MAEMGIGRILSFITDKVLVRWRNPGDTADMGTVADPVRVDPTGTTSQPVSMISITPGTGATNLGKAEDAPHTSGDVGVMLLGVRRDVPSPMAADGDYHPITIDQIGALTRPFDAATETEQLNQTQALQRIDDIVHFPADTLVAMAAVGGQLDDVATQVPIEDEAAALRITSARGLHSNLRNDAGTEIGTATNPVRTDTVGTTTQPISAASLPLPTGAATLAEQQTQTASLSVIDDWDESDRAKVNPIVGQAGVQGGSGAVTASTQRVAVATDVPVTVRGSVTTTGTVSGVTVSTTAVVIKASNANRKFIAITNNGTANVYLGTNSSVTASGAAMGLLLAPGGAMLDDGSIFGTGDVYGITSVVIGSQNVAVIERT